MTRNVVKRLANQNCVNCLFDLIGQSDLLSFGATEKNIGLSLGHRGLSGTKKTRRCSVKAVVPKVLQSSVKPAGTT